MQRTPYSRQILMKLELSRQIFENPQISNSMKIRPVRAEFFHPEEDNSSFSQGCSYIPQDKKNVKDHSQLRSL